MADGNPMTDGTEMLGRFLIGLRKIQSTITLDWTLAPVDMEAD